VQGEVGSEPSVHVLLVRLSDTESSFRYSEGFLAERGYKVRAWEKKINEIHPPEYK